MGDLDVLPWWLERQSDPAHPAFVAGVDANVTGRNWTAIGTVGAPERPLVDPCGLLTGPAGWSVDWWVNAGERWHRPSRDHTIRQSLVSAAPVVETRLRVPGGDVVSTSYAVPGQAVMEVTNDSPVPVAVAFAVRPYGPLHRAVVRTIELRDDRLVLVDGRLGLVLPHPPSGAVFAAGDDPDVLDDPLGPGDGKVTCQAGRARAAFVFPLAHRTAIRVALPLTGRQAPGAMADAETVARGWSAQAARDVEASLPPGRLAEVTAVSRRALLLVDPAPVEESPVVVRALHRAGFGAEAREVVRGLGSLQRGDGSFGSVRATSAALLAMGTHWRFDRGALADVLPHIGLAVRSIERGIAAASARDRAWAWHGVTEAVAILGAGGPPAAGVAAKAGAVRSRLDPGPDSRWALWVDRPLPGEGAVVGPLGIDVRATLAVAATELAAGDSGGYERLRRVVDLAGPTLSWPSYLHPTLHTGCAGSGQDGWTVAAFVDVVTDLLVGPVRPGGEVPLCPVLPPDWEGQPWEVRKLPTEVGVVSYAVRWHGARPAVLWEASLEPGASLVAPGLDPAWSATEPEGEVLLRR
jgi:hypothetical protein